MGGLSWIWPIKENTRPTIRKGEKRTIASKEKTISTCKEVEEIQEEEVSILLVFHTVITKFGVEEDH